MSGKIISIDTVIFGIPEGLFRVALLLKNYKGKPV